MTAGLVGGALGLLNVKRGHANDAAGDRLAFKSAGIWEQIHSEPLIYDKLPMHWRIPWFTRARTSSLFLQRFCQTRACRLGSARCTDRTTPQIELAHVTVITRLNGANANQRLG
jgi:hypothetical protein